MGVHIGGNKLVCTFPLFIDDAAVFLAGFAFKESVGYLVTSLLEAGHGGFVGTDAMAIMLGGKWGD